MSENTVPSFEQQMVQAVQSTVIKALRDGNWLAIEYKDRIRIDPAVLRAVYESVDMERVRNLVKEKVEERIADTMFNALVTEVATDVKQILSNRELREDIRSLLREKIRSAESALV